MSRTLTSKLGLAVLAAAVPLALGACGSSSKKSDTSSKGAAGSTPASSPAASGPAGDSVSIQGFKYAPPAITVKVGTKLTFKNSDNAEHTATADTGSAFDTGAINHGQSKPITLTKAGTFAYHCDFHPFMHGTVTAK
jgi:plastocyanin